MEKDFSNRPKVVSEMSCHGWGTRLKTFVTQGLRKQFSQGAVGTGKVINGHPPIPPGLTGFRGTGKGHGLANTV